MLPCNCVSVCFNQNTMFKKYVYIHSRGIQNYTHAQLHLYLKIYRHEKKTFSLIFRYLKIEKENTSTLYAPVSILSQQFGTYFNINQY